MKCKQCNRYFNKAWQIAQHTRKHHPKVVVQETLANTTTIGTIELNNYKVNYCPNCGVHLDKIDLH